MNQTEIASGCGVCMDDQCPTPFCSTSLEYDENYSISVTAFNTLRSSPPATFRETIGNLCCIVFFLELLGQLSRRKFPTKLINWCSNHYSYLKVHNNLTFS